MLAFLAMLTGTGMADTMLNSGFKKHCEIFHLSQPVSLPKIIGVKFGLITLGLYLQIVIISLLGVTAAGSYLAIKLGLSVAYAYTGMLQSLISMFFPFLFVVSFYWMFAGIFKNGSFMKSVAIVAGIEIARNILNKATGFHFPSLVSYLGKLGGLGSGVNISLADNKIGSLGMLLQMPQSTAFGRCCSMNFPCSELPLASSSSRLDIGSIAAERFPSPSYILI